MPRRPHASVAKAAPVRSEVAAVPGEAGFLAAYDLHAYERPSVAVDVVLLTVHDGGLRTLLCRRREHPFKGRWALPGTFVGIDEALGDAARRALREKGGLAEVFVEQLFTFGAPARDPRGRIISVAYFALVDEARLRAKDAAAGAVEAEVEVPWSGLAGGAVGARSEEGEALPLAFDHAEIIGLAVQRLRGKLDWAPVGAELLPERFTLLELQRVHEAVRGARLNKDSFRRRMLAGGALVGTGELETAVLHRPAELYRFRGR